MSASGARLSKAWWLHGEQGSARLLIQEAWGSAIDLGHEVGCAFGDLRLRGASPKCCLSGHLHASTFGDTGSLSRARFSDGVFSSTIRRTQKEGKLGEIEQYLP